MSRQVIPATSPIYRLELAALRLIISGPARRAANTSTATVSHDALDDLREALSELGVDWQRARVRAGRRPFRDERPEELRRDWR